MKKYLFLSLIIILSTCYAIAETPSDKFKKNVTYPSTQSYTKVQTPATKTMSSQATNIPSSSSPLSAEAKRVLSAAISRNNSAWNSAMQKMMDKGGIPGDTNVTSKCPRNPKLPTITVNGKTMKGNVCAKMTYTYNGQSYEEGFCK